MTSSALGSTPTPGKCLPPIECRCPNVVYQVQSNARDKNGVSETRSASWTADVVGRADQRTAVQAAKYTKGSAKVGEHMCTSSVCLHDIITI